MVHLLLHTMHAMEPKQNISKDDYERELEEGRLSLAFQQDRPHLYLLGRLQEMCIECR
jgi:hypothetical protein